MPYGVPVSIEDYPTNPVYEAILAVLLNNAEPLTTKQVALAARCSYQTAHLGCSWWYRRDMCERVTENGRVRWLATEGR